MATLPTPLPVLGGKGLILRQGPAPASARCGLHRALLRVGPRAVRPARRRGGHRDHQRRQRLADEFWRAAELHPAPLARVLDYPSPSWTCTPAATGCSTAAARPSGSNGSAADRTAVTCGRPPGRVGASAPGSVAAGAEQRQCRRHRHAEDQADLRGLSGVHRKIPNVRGGGGDIPAEQRPAFFSRAEMLSAYIAAIADRLERVRVCCGDWRAHRYPGLSPRQQKGRSRGRLPRSAVTAPRTAMRTATATTIRSAWPERSRAGAAPPAPRSALRIAHVRLRRRGPRIAGGPRLARPPLERPGGLCVQQNRNRHRERICVFPRLPEGVAKEFSTQRREGRRRKGRRAWIIRRSSIGRSSP